MHATLTVNASMKDLTLSSLHDPVFKQGAAGDVFCRGSASAGLVQKPVQIAAAHGLRDLTLFLRSPCAK
jgi:hypothetical protein